MRGLQQIEHQAPSLVTLLEESARDFEQILKEAVDLNYSAILNAASRD